MKRIVITGLGINTALGDSLDEFYEGLIAGRSGVTSWRFFEHSGVASKVGGDLSDYDAAGKIERLRADLDPDAHKSLRQICRRAPFSTRLATLVACDAWIDAGLHQWASKDADQANVSVLLGGHNLNECYLVNNQEAFNQDPDFMDPMSALLVLDTDHAASIAEVLRAKGACYTLGGACASANMAIRAAIDEIRYHDHDIAVVVGGVLDFSPMGLHALALMGAITVDSFNDAPEKASRPYDARREGFVPSHGAAALVVEDLDHAIARGAPIYAEVLGCTTLSDGSHLPAPSPVGQSRTIQRLLKRSGLELDAVDFISAHATSTPQGDISELSAIKTVFGEHAKRLRINALKSLLGHTCWSAPAVETVAGLLQMKYGRLHPSINIDDMDEDVDLDVCANKPVDHRINVMLKNSFGFGGLNCCALYRRFEG